MSKRSESIKALRQMNDEELVVHLRQQRRKLFEVRFQQATGQVENHRLIRDLRREIGRTMTVQIEFARTPVEVTPTAPTPRRTPPVRAPRESPRPVRSVAAEPSASTEAVAVQTPAPPRRRSRAKVADEPVAVETTAPADEKEEANTDE
jgi:large subunit ribosomal protein L29